MRLLLEGPAIEPLLARVREEHGEHARIVAAEKVRTGGLGGFFSKEHFEITVEVDETAAAPAEPAPAVPAPAVPAQAVPAPAVPAQRAAEPVPAPVGLDALLAAAEEEELATAPLTALAPVPVAVAAAAFAAASAPAPVAAPVALAEPVGLPEPVEAEAEVGEQPQPW